MPRWGYAVVAVLVAVLAAYVFWPSGAAQLAVFPAEIRPPFIVSGALGEQEVAERTVRVAGLERQPDEMAILRFTGIARSLRVPAERVVEGVDAAQARAWGIDGRRRFAMGAEERLWGEAEGAAAVWDPATRRAFLLTPAELRRLDEAAARLDQKPLLSWQTLSQAARLTLDEQRLERREGAWRFADGERPPCSGRVQRLLSALQRVELASLAGAPSSATVRHTLRLAVEAQELTIALLADGGQWWVRLGEHPAQPSGDDWEQLIAAFAGDLLLDPADPALPDAFSARRAGRPWFTLARRGAYGDDGQKPWRVRWEAGDELAARDAGERLHAALLAIGVREARPQSGPPSWPEAVELVGTLTYHGEQLRVVLGDGWAWAGGWLGRVAELPPLLATLQPVALLDASVLPVDAERLVKLQRRWPDAARDETYARAAGGSWARTHPPGAPPADPQALARLARALTRLVAEEVRLATPADRALPAALELAVRIAPRAVQQTTVDDDLDIADTIPQDAAWRLVRREEGWWLVDLLGSLAWRIGETEAEALQSDVTSRRLVAVPPTMVSAIELSGPASWRLQRQGAQWRLQQGGEEAPADAVAVRRLLRDLTTLPILGPAEGLPAERSTVLSVELIDGERLVMRLWPRGEEWLAITAHGTVRIAAEAWQRLVLDPAAYRAP